MAARRTKPIPDEATEVLTSEQKQEILKDPEAVKELLNTDEAKEQIASLVDSEEITKIIEKRVKDQVDFQTSRIPDQYKQYGFIKEGNRSYRMVEI